MQFVGRLNFLRSTCDFFVCSFVCVDGGAGDGGGGAGDGGGGEGTKNADGEGSRKVYAVE